MADICAICKHPRSKHDVMGVCPPRSTFFAPCLHQRRQGIACVSPDGNGWSDSTCMDCGERFVFGKRP